MSETNVELLQSAGFKPTPMECDYHQLPISGNWPQQLRGTLYRIGPNPQFSPRGDYNPLMGDGMVHAFTIDQGRVAYRNRWVRTRQWQLEREAGRALFASSGDPRQHDASVLAVATNGVANTNLLWQAGRLLCLEESHAPIEIDPGTLETLGSHTLGAAGNFTAHPKIDPASGETFGFANYPEGKFNGDIVYSVIDADGNTTQSQRFRAPIAGLVHDFAVSKNYIIFLICPATISVQRAMKGQPGLAWEPDQPTTIGVIPRRGSVEDIIWIERKPCFVWHILNAWDQGDSITIDLCEQAEPAFPRADGSMGNSEANNTFLTRWQLSIAAEPSVSCRRLSDEVCEYPRIDERFAMTDIRHGYFASGGGAGEFFQRGISHYNFTTQTMTSYSFGPHCSVHEPVFVAGSAAAAEGEGYILTVVYNELTDHSQLAVFDAQQLSAGPIAHAQLEHRVPVGFHGLWLNG